MSYNPLPTHPILVLDSNKYNSQCSSISNTIFSQNGYPSSGSVEKTRPKHIMEEPMKLRQQPFQKISLPWRVQIRVRLLTKRKNHNKQIILAYALRIKSCDFFIRLFSLPGLYFVNFPIQFLYFYYIYTEYKI